MIRSLLLLSCLIVAGGVALGEEFKSVKDARSEAAKQQRARNIAGTQAPLEAVLKLLPPEDVKGRVETYRHLMAAYRLLGEPDKMIEAVEYIQEHSDGKAERSVVATDFVSFLHQRGKTDMMVARYEERLKKSPKDPTALAYLARVFNHVKRDQKARGKELEQALAALDKERSAEKAKRLEDTADADPMSAAANWKDVALAWLEAGDKDKARAAAEKAQTAPPEARGALLSYYWHDGMGQVYAELGDSKKAIEHFEKSIALAPGDALKKPIQEKLDKVRAKAQP